MFLVQFLILLDIQFYLEIYLRTLLIFLHEWVITEWKFYSLPDMAQSTTVFMDYTGVIGYTVCAMQAWAYFLTYKYKDIFTNCNLS